MVRLVSAGKVTKVEAEVADKFLAVQRSYATIRQSSCRPKKPRSTLLGQVAGPLQLYGGKLIHTILHPETPPLAVNSTEVLNDLYYAARLAPDNIQVVGTAAAMVLMSFNNDAHVTMLRRYPLARQLPQDLEERIVPMFRLLEDAARCPDSCLRLRFR